jgi:pimeloyl-ACP methyl ester carboxylesterase
MSRRFCVLVAALAMTLSGGVIVASAAPATSTAPKYAGLPADGPRALYRDEPRLPAPHGWPAHNAAFSRTSGTGRFADGAFYWTDYLYDDHGTTTASTGGGSVTAGTPSFGTYTYPAGPSFNNGADIFRAAVALRRHASYWRVDWETLAKANVPIAEWTFDRDNNSSTGASNWPGNAGVHSPGVDTALIVSAQHAELVNLASGRPHRLHVSVDRRAASFVVRLPTSLLRPTKSWRVRLAAGLANPAGTDFTEAADALPTQTAVYNVTFRTRAQEVPTDDFWNDKEQTNHLATGNVAPFSHLIRWRQLRHRRTTPQPLLRGWSDRWYVSAVAPGNGVITDAATVSDGKANYLGRVQPYAIYVPRGYRHGQPSPLTFLLHSSNQNHNQYAATTPNFTKRACEDRDSICVSPLGRGPDGNYFGTAELDFWQVWHAVWLAYNLDPQRTVLAGYSMGGVGANQLAMEHPDLFARSITLAGGIGNIDSLANLRWVPTYLAGGAEDELVPVNLQAGEANALKRLGYRFRWIVVAAIDHVSYELADSFQDAVRYMRTPSLNTTPGRVDFTWTPKNTPPPVGVSAESPPGIGWTQRRKLGVTTTGAYWLRHLHARSKATDASIVAKSGARTDRSETTHFYQHVDPTFQPDAATIAGQIWRAGNRPARKRLLRLQLTNVRALKVRLSDAGFQPGERVKLVVVSDGRCTVHLSSHLRTIDKGRHVIRFRV